MFQFFVKYHLDVFLYFQVRDYIHVVDLSDGHIAALRKLFDVSNIGRLPSLMSAIYYFSLCASDCLWRLYVTGLKKKKNFLLGNLRIIPTCFYWYPSWGIVPTCFKDLFMGSARNHINSPMHYPVALLWLCFFFSRHRIPDFF